MTFTPHELTELAHAQELPAWTRIKVRDDIVGWRALTAHEICVLNEMFNMLEMQDFQDVGKTLGLIADKNDE